MIAQLAQAPDREALIPARAPVIPVRNVWHMLVYAWSDKRIPDAINRGRVECEHAPTVDALVALLLAQLLEQRLRVGLGHGYVSESGMVRGVRGRIDFGESLKRLSFKQGKAYCNYQTFSPNIKCNQIVRSTLLRLTQVGDFGGDQRNGLRLRLRRLVRDLEGVDLVEIDLDLLRRERLRKNDADYKMMLAACELFWKGRMPTESVGDHHLLGIDRNILALDQVYELFVARFYKTNLLDWDVWPQKRLTWPSMAPNSYLPKMIPDLTFEHKTNGRRIILDTKFTANSLVTTQFGKQKFDSSHMYQIYAYLRTQEGQGVSHRDARGVLLYPTINQNIDVEMLIQRHAIRVVTVDLAAPWKTVESRLLDLVS